jgi:hypothetical protein
MPSITPNGTPTICPKSGAVEALVSNGKPEDVQKEPSVWRGETEVGQVEVLVELVPLGGLRCRDLSWFRVVPAG